VFGCANQAGEDNRNVARMALLLAGLPQTSRRPRSTGCAAPAWTPSAPRPRHRGRRDRAGHRGRRREHVARAVRDAEGRVAFARENAVFDTTIGWRFVNPLMKQMYGTDSMPETAENVADDFGISRADQDAFALAQPGEGLGRAEVRPVRPRDRAGDDPREEGRPGRRRPRRAPARDLDGGAGEAEADRAPDGTVTAGNASGVNDGARR
jgi:acetyl-CoA acyltransferase